MSTNNLPGSAHTPFQVGLLDSWRQRARRMALYPRYASEACADLSWKIPNRCSKVEESEISKMHVRPMPLKHNDCRLNKHKGTGGTPIF